VDPARLFSRLATTRRSRSAIPRTQRLLTIPAASAGLTRMNARLASILSVPSSICMQHSSSLRSLPPICALRLFVLGRSSVEDRREERRRESQAEGVVSVDGYNILFLFMRRECVQQHYLCQHDGRHGNIIFDTTRRRL
jgi:hypothetical protein